MIGRLVLYKPGGIPIVCPGWAPLTAAAKASSQYVRQVGSAPQSATTSISPR